MFTNEQLAWMYNAEQAKKDALLIKDALRILEWTPISDRLWRATAQILAENWITTTEHVISVWLDWCMRYIKNPVAKEAFKKFYDSITE